MMMFKMLILKKLSKILHYTKTCLSGTFFFAIKSVMNKNLKLKIINRSNKNTLMELLNIKYIDVGENYLVAKMPVNSKVLQPDKVLHGGASVALAESVGSAASYLFINPVTHTIRGIQISANHLRSVKNGFVFARANPIHIGKRTHIWEIQIKDKEDNLVSHCKLTTMVLEKK